MLVADPAYIRRGCAPIADVGQGFVAVQFLLSGGQGHMADPELVGNGLFDAYRNASQGIHDPLYLAKIHDEVAALCRHRSNLPESQP